MGLKWVLATLGLNTLGATAYAVKVRSLPFSILSVTIFIYSISKLRAVFMGYLDNNTDIAQFPERWFKRTFDIFGASHQWLHIMVIFAGLAHTFGVLSAFDFLHAHLDQCKVEPTS